MSNKATSLTDQTLPAEPSPDERLEQMFSAFARLLSKIDRLEAEIHALRTKRERLNVGRDEAAEMLAISVSKLDQMIEAGEIDSCKIGRRRVIPVDTLESYQQQMRARA